MAEQTTTPAGIVEAVGAIVGENEALRAECKRRDVELNRLRQAVVDIRWEIRAKSLTFFGLVGRKRLEKWTEDLWKAQSGAEA